MLDRMWSISLEKEFDVVTGTSRRLGTGVGQQMDGVNSASKIEFRHSEKAKGFVPHSAHRRLAPWQTAERPVA